MDEDEKQLIVCLQYTPQRFLEFNQYVKNFCDFSCVRCGVKVISSEVSTKAIRRQECEPICEKCFEKETDEIESVGVLPEAKDEIRTAILRSLAKNN